MKRRNYRAKRQAATFPLWPLLKGALLATAVILLLMGMWTLLLYGGIASLGTIPVANAVLKFLGAGLAAFLSANKSCSRPALYGGLGGVLFWGLTFFEHERVYRRMGSELGDIGRYGCFAGCRYGCRSCRFPVTAGEELMFLQQKRTPGTYSGRSCYPGL